MSSPYNEAVQRLVSQQKQTRDSLQFRLEKLRNDLSGLLLAGVRYKDQESLDFIRQLFELPAAAREEFVQQHWGAVHLSKAQRILQELAQLETEIASGAQ
jgi:hypothetical protein